MDDLIRRMQVLLEPMQAAGDPRPYFHATYLRTTMAVAVADEIEHGGLVDAEWTARWDATFTSSTWMRLKPPITGGSTGS